MMVILNFLGLANSMQMKRENDVMTDLGGAATTSAFDLCPPASS